MNKRLTRRRFILNATAGGVGLLKGPAALALAGGASGLAGGAGPGDERGALLSLSKDLTALWAETLLGLQVTDTSRLDLYGGILCPTEHIVHGRVGDTIYPFLHMARRTGDHRYVDGSVLLYLWMENQVSQPDGSWLNEPASGSWKGTTVFTVIALCEALFYHGDLLEPAFRKTIGERLVKAGNFICTNFTIDYGNINYPLSATYALSLLGTLLDIPRFREKGRELAQQGLKFFTQKDGFLYGEGTPYYQASPKGCLSVDLGYNVEESLPSLALYGLLTKDEEMLETVTRSLRTHLEFLLPDGGWDNSWGTRNYKWTWWGSRTSDGCAPAYGLLADRDPRFARAAYLNTQLLQRTTEGGLLYGGPHYGSHHIPTSVHHTFCHIKSLTTILDHGLPEEGGAGGTGPGAAGAGRPVAGGVPAAAKLLPRETQYGSRWLADIQTLLVSTGGYRATVTAYDREYKGTFNGHATGGALSLLWHEQTGPLLVASMNAYQLVEAGNMQVDADPLSMPLTPRIELDIDGETYMNISDLGASVMVVEAGSRSAGVGPHGAGAKGDIIVRTRSRLVNKDQRDPSLGVVSCFVDYTFSPEKVTLSFRCEEGPYGGKTRIILPVISPSGESADSTGDKIFQFRKEKALVTLSSDQPLQRLPTTGDRIFNFVPGLEAVPIGVKGNSAIITIKISH